MKNLITTILLTVLFIVSINAQQRAMTHIYYVDAEKMESVNSDSLYLYNSSHNKFTLYNYGKTFTYEILGVKEDVLTLQTTDGSNIKFLLFCYKESDSPNIITVTFGTATSDMMLVFQDYSLYVIVDAYVKMYQNNAKQLKINQTTSN